MTQPSRITGFLDIFGRWDPTLAFVMAGAVAVHFGGRLLVEKRERPLWTPRFVLPTRRDIDARLIGGAVLFGMGWGLAGYCPGPSITSLGTNAIEAWVFVASMTAGMLLFHAFETKRDAARVEPRVR